MPRRLGLDWGRIATQASYTMSKHVRAYLAMSLVAGGLFSISLVVFVIPGGMQALYGFGFFIVFIYIISTIMLSQALASELESGEALLYLSTPLSRLEYTASWLIASVASSIITLAIILLAPVAIWVPSLLSNTTFLGVIAAMLCEVLYYASVLTFVAVVSRRRTITVATAFFLLVIGPVISGIILALYESIAEPQDPEMLSRLFRLLVGVYHPLALTDINTLDTTGSIIYSIIVSTAALLLTIIYARDRLEV